MDTITEDITGNKKLARAPRQIQLSEIELMLERVRLRARRRIAWLRNVWMNNHNPDGDNDQPGYHTEVAGYLNDADQPAAEARWYKEEESIRPLNRRIAIIEKAQLTDETSRLGRLVALFGLSPEESDILQTCLAISLQSNLGRVYAYLQDHSGRGYVTGELVARLFDHGLYLPLSAESPLKVWDLVRETEMGASDPLRLEIDPFVRNWILGKDDLPDSLVGKAVRQPYREALKSWPVQETLVYLNKILNKEKVTPLRIFIAGSPGSGRASFAACLCERPGLALLTIDSDRIAENRWIQTYVHAQRYAYLNHYALAWKGTPAMERYWPENISPFPLQFIIGEQDEYILPIQGVIDHRVETRPLETAEKRRLWLQYMPQATAWPKPELSAMLQRYSAGIGQIISISNEGVNSIAEASEALRAHSRRRLGELAQQMNSQFSWDDLVVPDWLQTSLEDFVFEARQRTVLWEQPGVKRLFPQGKGLFALFTGFPGTGKTMAAQVIANSLQLDLFRIDLSTIVSKYVGETSKNIERIFSRARSMDIVLFFDEADALFGKRTEVKDAHDRYANTDTNYLLQAMEQYPGVAILASNKKTNIDEGFTRRLRYVMDFQKPDAAHRLRLWRQISRELAGAESAAALDQDFVTLSEMMELAGSQIKSALLSAMFMAFRDHTTMTQKHVLTGLEKELMKDGRTVTRVVKEFFKQDT